MVRPYPYTRRSGAKALKFLYKLNSPKVFWTPSLTRRGCSDVFAFLLT